MTSINTNLAATSALRTLQATNSALDATQSRISTGLKIGEAKDNAAYWSITTTLKSDNKAMATVKDALGLGAATVDTAYEGLTATVDVLNEIKSKLTAASQDGVNKTAVQAEIGQLIKQIESIANSSAFSNENWLKVATTGIKSVVGSFTTDVNGSVTIGKIDVDTASTALYVGADKGVMQDKTVTGRTATTALTYSATNFAFNDANDAITVNITLGSTTKALILNQAAATAAGITDGVIDTKAKLATLLTSVINAEPAFKDQLSVSLSSDTNSLVFKSKGDTAITLAANSGAAGDITVAMFQIVAKTPATNTSDNTKIEASVSSINIVGKTASELQEYIQVVNTAIKSVTTAASSLGAAAKRIDLQKSFVQNLMDTIDKGVSGLIDADMNEESTKLQALQVKQQLGVQALSIANQSAQNVLSLFRS